WEVTLGSVCEGAEDERAVEVDGPHAPSLARDVVAQPADAGSPRVDLALDRGPFVGRRPTQGTVSRAGLDDQHEPRSVPFETLEGRSCGLYGPLDENFRVRRCPLVESLRVAQPGRIGGFQACRAGERL